MLADLFVNLCILISLIFVYIQIRWKLPFLNNTSRIYPWIDGIGGGVLGVVLMLFSIHVTEETLVDLRYIPVMLLMLFLGVKPAVIASTIIVFFRFVIGVNFSAYAALFLMLFLLLGFCIILKKIDSIQLYKRVIFFILHANISFSITLYLVVGYSSILIELLIVYWLFSVIGGFSSAFFVQYLIKTHELLVKYEKESTTDFLTGLNNVRSFDKQLNLMAKQARESKSIISLLLLDIDYFKRVNDVYGHKSGDLVLMELGKLLQLTSRDTDILSRNGGEEFSIIVPFTTKSEAVEYAQSIRETVEKHLFIIEKNKRIRVTVSVGVASSIAGNTSVEQLVQRADEALYEAKKTGRNRVCTFEKETSATK